MFVSETSRVIVIGAGAAGLVSARELKRAGFEVTILEQSNHVGGIWQYDADTEDDPLGLNPGRRVHSSLYASLHTNLPRDLMAFLDYPFDSQGGGHNNWPRYPHHTQVCQYLQRFAADFNLVPLIQFDSQVTDVTKLDSSWRVSVNRLGEIDHLESDAVVVCNGHYSEPRVPRLKGMDSFPGELLHAHNYRQAKPFQNKRVAVFGTAASGFDLALELSKVAAQVYWLGHEQPQKSTTLPGVINARAPIAFDGTRIKLLDESTIADIECFIFATGYRYSFPFLNSLIDVEDNMVAPLYKDILPPALPSLAFIGLPYLVIPFPLFQVQASWFANMLSGRTQLPNDEKMSQIIKTDLQQRGSRLKRHHHRLADEQIPYMNQLLAEIDAPALPDWFGKLITLSQQNRMRDPAGFRQIDLPKIAPTVISLPD